jgi:hypothetical protein
MQGSQGPHVEINKLVFFYESKDNLKICRPFVVGEVTTFNNFSTHCGLYYDRNLMAQIEVNFSSNSMQPLTS